MSHRALLPFRRLWHRLHPSRLSFSDFERGLREAGSADEVLRLLWRVHPAERQVAERQVAKQSAHWSPALFHEVLESRYERLTDLAMNPALTGETARAFLDWMVTPWRFQAPPLPHQDGPSYLRGLPLYHVPHAAGQALVELARRGELPASHPAYQAVWQHVETERRPDRDLLSAVLAHPEVPASRLRTLLSHLPSEEYQTQLRLALLRLDAPEHAAEHAEWLLKASPGALTLALPHLSVPHRRQVPRRVWAELLAGAGGDARLSLIRALPAEGESAYEKEPEKRESGVSGLTALPSSAPLTPPSRRPLR